MATPELRTEKIDALKEKLSELAGIDPQSLARTSDLSPDINFKDAVPSFEEMLELCKQLNQRDVSRLPTQQLDTIDGAIKFLGGLLNKVRNFTLNQNTPGDVCQAIITEVQNAYDTVMNPLLLPLAFTATQATDYAKIEREAKGYQTTMKAEAEKLSEFITTTRAEAQSALDAVKEQAAEAGVSTNAQTFLTQAKQHKDMASKWAVGTIVMSSVTLVAALAGLALAIYYHPQGTAATIQFVVSKLIVLSTLSFGILWCARNYRAQKHNETLNKHRANSLMTFRAFVEGTSDDRVKDAILMQAAQAAFSGKSTGFDASDTDARTINPVVEVIGKSLQQGGDVG